MDPAWVTAAVGIVAILGTMSAGVRNSGARDEKLKTLGREMGEVKRVQETLGDASDKHGRQLVRIETKLNLPPIGD